MGLRGRHRLRGGRRCSRPRIRLHRTGGCRRPQGASLARRASHPRRTPLTAPGGSDGRKSHVPRGAVQIRSMLEARRNRAAARRHKRVCFARPGRSSLCPCLRRSAGARGRRTGVRRPRVSRFQEPPEHPRPRRAGVRSRPHYPSRFSCPSRPCSSSAGSPAGARTERALGWEVALC